MAKKTNLQGKIKQNVLKGETKHSKLHGSVTVGAKGDSTYEIWLKEGNTGSIEDFLRSQASDIHFKHKQNIPSKEWIINHDLYKYPSVTVVDSSNTIVYGEVTYIDNNTIKVSFSSEFSGKAYLN